MSFLNIATWNAQGIQSDIFRHQKINYLLNADFICVQELRLNTNDDVNDVENLWNKGKMS